MGELEEAASLLHLDVMDGQLVHEQTFPLDDLAPFSNSVKVEIHAMAAKPGEILERAAELGVRRFVFHLESFSSVVEAAAFAEEVSRQGMNPVLTCWPSSDLPIIPGVRYYQLMGVVPGEAGQRLLESTAPRLVRLSQELPENGKIQVDGGVNRHTIAGLSRAGARRFVVNTAFWHADDRLTALHELKSLAEGGIHGLSISN